MNTQEILCPASVERITPLTLYCCDGCSAIAVTTGEEPPVGWEVGQGASMCPVCAREAA